jgi:hypothetical protein
MGGGVGKNLTFLTAPENRRYVIDSYEETWLGLKPNLT